MAGGKAPGKKAAQKEKEKVIQDKTFGLKNKKNAKVQKYVAQVKQQVNNAGQKKRADLPPKSKKELEQEKKAELNQIFKPVTIQQKVDVGVDPKSVLCQFFKQGLCTKGAKCKFSHDLEITRKVEKINLYVDQRDLDEEKSKDVMDDWDQSKLESVVGQKNKQNTTTTDIVCKFFLAAIEAKKYGWFWECPNGGEACPYRHALPPGFVLKTKDKPVEDEGPKMAVEDEIEDARRKLVGDGTPVTLERFLKWKEDKRAKAEKEKADREKELGIRSDRGPKSMMNGREMFVFNPDLFVDDEEALEDYEKEEEQFDLNVPHNVITVTSTSITLTAKKIPEDAEVGAVDESLFVDDGEVPDISDDEADP